MRLHKSTVCHLTCISFTAWVSISMKFNRKCVLCFTFSLVKRTMKQRRNEHVNVTNNIESNSLIWILLSHPMKRAHGAFSFVCITLDSFIVIIIIIQWTTKFSLSDKKPYKMNFYFRWLMPFPHNFLIKYQFFSLRKSNPFIASF